MISVKISKYFLRLTLFLVLGLSACIPYRKTVPIDGDKNNPLDTSAFFEYQRDIYRLKGYDIVDIQFYSPNPEASLYFDKTFSRGGAATSNVSGLSGGDIYYMTGYVLDDSGYVKLPILGNFKASGKTINELRTELEDSLSLYFKKDYIYVTVKLGGIRYVVMGEVNNPGAYVKLQNQVSLLEALAAAGDFTAVSNRQEVIIYRQYPEGTRAHKVNLLDQNILSSEFYFLMPNDIVQVKPLRIKSLGLGDAFLQNTTSIVSFTVSVLSLYLLLQQSNG